MFRKLDHRFVHYLLLIALASLLFIVRLGSAGLWDMDEAKNSEAAREMMVSGNWIVPTFDYELRCDKPALLYWLQIAAFRSCGVNEFAARLPSALMAILLVLLTYEMGRRMFDARTGLLAGMILGSTAAVCMSARFANPDALLSACTTLTLVCFWNSYARADRWWLALCGAASALAVLAKGPVGVLLPSCVILAFLLLQRQVHRIWDRRVLLGVLLFVLIALPWYALVGVETKGEFLRGFFGEHHLRRFTEVLDKHRGPFYYYPLVLCLGLGPWMMFLGVAAWYATGKRLKCDYLLNARIRDDTVVPEEAPRCCWFLWLWIAVYLLFFSIARTKLPNYILPVYPAVALLIARFLERWRRGQVLASKAFGVYIVAALCLCGMVTAIGLLVASGNIPSMLPQRHRLPCLAPYAALGAIPVLGAAVAAWCLARQRRAAVLGTLVVTISLYTLGLFGFGMPALGQLMPSRPLAVAVQTSQQEPEVRLATYAFFEPSLVFYCRREVRELCADQEVFDLLEYPVQVYVFMPKEEWHRLEQDVPSGCHVVGSAPSIYDGLEVVAVTNR